MIRRFAGLTLDDERFELRRGDEGIRLEPRALELLLFLARHPGRLVTKEELLREVWKSKFVSDDAITFALAAVRRAVGSGVVTTVHGRGFRFDAAIEPGSAAGIPVPAGDPLTELPARRRRPGGARWAAVLVVGALVLSLVAWLVARGGVGKSPRPPRAQAAASAATARLVLAPPELDGGDSALSMLALTLSDALRLRLDRVPGLALVAEDPARPDAVAKLVLAFERDPRPDQARLRVYLLEPGDGSRLQVGRFDIHFLRSAKDLAAFDEVRDAVARYVVGYLLPAVELGPPLPGLVPRDPEAYRLYLTAESRADDVTCDSQAFVDLLRASIARDREFAPAWEVLGWAQYGRVAYCGGDPSHYAGALASVEEARARVSDLPDGELLKMSILVETGRWSEAYRAFEAAAARGARVAPWEYGRSCLLAYVGEVAAAERHLEASVAADPAYLSFNSWTPNALLYAGKVERFLALVPAATSPLMRYYQGEAFVRLGRRAEAIAVLAPAFSSNPADLFARLDEAYRLHLEGDAAGALAVLRALERDREESGASDGEVTFKVASLFARLGERTEAMRVLARSVAQDFVCGPCFENDPAFAALAADPEFAALARRARERARALLESVGEHPAAL